MVFWLVILCSFAKGQGAFTNAVETFDAAWRIIEETHYDRDFNGVDWKKVRDELRPRAERARTKPELDAIIQDMLNRLGQSHMDLLPQQPSTNRKGKPRRDAVRKEDPARESGSAGIDARFLDGRWVVTRVDNESPASRAGVHPGWIISRLSGMNADDFAPVRDGKTEGASYVEAWSEVNHLLKGEVGSKVSLSFIKSSNESVALDLNRQRPLGEAAKLGNLPTFFAEFESNVIPSATGRKLGYIRFNIWMMPIAYKFSQAMERLRGVEGIIIDLRGNVGGVAGLVMGISGHFLEDPLSLGTMKTREGELQFRSNPRKVNLAGERVTPFAGPVAILVDQISLSASEIFAGGMQAIGRAHIFGEQTGGMALPASFDQLPNGDLLVHALGDFITPTGVRLEGRGVVPDEKVAAKRDDLLAGRDAPLLAAMAWISQESGKRTRVKVAAERSGK